MVRAVGINALSVFIYPLVYLADTSICFVAAFSPVTFGCRQSPQLRAGELEAAGLMTQQGGRELTGL